MDINIKKTPILYVDNPISELLSKTQATASASEDDVKNILRRYPTRDVLITLAKASFELLNNTKLRGRINACLYQDEEKGVMVSQFALAYLSNLSLISGSNDFKNAVFYSRDNFLGMCQVYNNCVRTVLDKEELKREGMAPFMIRMYTEQIEYQVAGHDIFARTFMIYLEIAPKIDAKSFKDLDSAHMDGTGLSINDFLWLSFGFFAISFQTLTFGVDNLKNSDIPKLKEVFTEEKIKRFLKLMSLTYNEFRELDSEKNKNLNPEYTKTRFNPLIQYPVIEFQNKSGLNPYIIANIITYLRRSFNGLFWWFDNYFMDKGEKERQDYRIYFGHVFQEYVGQVLGVIYGKNVKPEFKYGTKKKSIFFTDWWVDLEEKVYLFEAKANQFNLNNRQTCDVARFKAEEIPKLSKSVIQLFKICRDIESEEFPELKQFLGKKIVPVVVFYDMPFVSEKNLYGNWLREKLIEEEGNNPKLKGISEFCVHMLNIDQLEAFESIKDDADLEDVFIKNDNSGPADSIISIMSKESSGKGLKSNFLQKAYDRFFSSQGFKKIIED